MSFAVGSAMKLRKVISGGQTGADFTALLCAQAIGLETGGTCPKGCRTDAGPNMALVTEFGLVESEFWEYPPRTRDNVRNSDVTVWFGRTTSPGFRCTRKACRAFKKPLICNPDNPTLRQLRDKYRIVNVAGNRARTNPGVIHQVMAAFEVIAEDL